MEDVGEGLKVTESLIEELGLMEVVGEGLRVSEDVLLIEGLGD